jgi:hypothetical protein
MPSLIIKKIIPLTASDNAEIIHVNNKKKDKNNID